MIGVAALGAIGVVIFKNNARPDPDEGLPVRPVTTTTTEAPKVQPPPQPPGIEQPKAPAQAEQPTVQAKNEGAGRDDNADAPRVGSRAIRVIEAGKENDRDKGKDKDTKLAPEAAHDLDEAEAALAAGKPGDALRLAQHSLYAQKSSRAYAVITRARCAQGDLGNAKAALAQVSARDRSTVVRACGKLGIELR
jgi:serine/threonine-protein kinase